MLCGLLLALLAQGQDSPVHSRPLIVSASAELVLPQYSGWAAFVYDRTIGSCWLTSTMGFEIRGPRRPAGIIDVGDLEVLAVGRGRDEHLGVVAIKKAEALGDISVSVFETDLHATMVSDGEWQSETKLRWQFDLDELAKGSIRKEERMAPEMVAKLAGTTFTVTKAHVETLGDSKGPLAIFLGIEDVTSLFRGVLVVTIDQQEALFFPSSLENSFAVASGRFLVRASAEGPFTMDVVQWKDGEWVEERTVDLPAGAFIRSAYDSGTAFFTVSGDWTGVWSINLFGGDPQRTEMSELVNKMAFSQGVAYWLDGTTIKLRDIHWRNE